MGVYKKFRKYAGKQAKRAWGGAKKRYGGSGGLSKLYSDVKMIKTAINSERKYWDVTNADVSITDLSPFLLLPWDGIANGTQVYQRVGDQVKALYTQIRFKIDYNPSGLTAGATNTCRIMAIQDTESRGATRSSGTAMRDFVLEHTGTNSLAMRSPYRVSTQTSGVPGGRFKILRDFKVDLDNVYKKQREIKVTLRHTANKAKGLKLKYEAVNNFSVDDALYFLIITDTTTASDMQIQGYNSRVCFVDN